MPSAKKSSGKAQIKVKDLKATKNPKGGQIKLHGAPTSSSTKGWERNTKGWETN